MLAEQTNALSKLNPIQTHDIEFKAANFGSLQALYEASLIQLPSIRIEISKNDEGDE